MKKDCSLIHLGLNYLIYIFNSTYTYMQCLVYKISYVLSHKFHCASLYLYPPSTLAYSKTAFFMLKYFCTI